MGQPYIQTQNHYPGFMDSIEPKRNSHKEKSVCLSLSPPSPPSPSLPCFPLLNLSNIPNSEQKPQKTYLQYRLNSQLLIPPLFYYFLQHLAGTPCIPLFIWIRQNNNNNNNERISRAPFHMEHALLRWTGANTKHMHIRHLKQQVSKQSCRNIQLSSKNKNHKSQILYQCTNK